MWERGLVRDVPFEGVLEWEPDGEIKTSRDQCDTAPAAPFSDRSVGLEGDVFVPRRLRAALAGSERLGRAHPAAATRALRARQGEGTVSADGPVRRGALGRSSAPRRASSGRLGPLRRTCSAPVRTRASAGRGCWGPALYPAARLPGVCSQRLRPRRAVVTWGCAREEREGIGRKSVSPL